MQRRKALAAAGAVTMTAFAATIALGVNLGLFGLTDDTGGPGNFGPVGNEKPTAPVVATERTEVIDVPVPVYVSGSDGAPAAVPPAAGSAPAGASGSGGKSSGSSGRSSAGSAASGPTGTAPSGEHVEAPEPTEAHEPEVHEPEVHEPEVHEPETEEPHADD